MSEPDPSPQPPAPATGLDLSSPAAAESSVEAASPVRETVRPWQRTRLLRDEAWKETETSSEEGAASRRPRSRWWRWLFIPASAAAVAGLVIFALVWQYYSAEAEKYDLTALPKLSQGTRVLDREGHYVGTVFAGDRKFVEIHEVPQHLVDAVIATEDARFFRHSGVDVKAILRAFVANTSGMSVRQGGSTITQQLSRQAFQLRGRNLQRKLRETFIAMRLERAFEKDQILEYYLNHIYLGNGFNGIGSAARGYFGKDVKDLLPEEAAMLAGIIKAPVTFSPYRSPDSALRARNLTLDRMQTLGSLSPEAASVFKVKPLGVLPEHRRVERPDYIIAALERELVASPRDQTSESVNVTVNVALQSKAAEILARHIARVEKQFAPPGGQPLQGAVIVLDNETGQILATIGGRDYRTSPFDRALQGQRPVGTAFLPLAYAAMFSMRPEMASSWVLDGPLDNRRAMVGGLEGTLGEWGGEGVPAVFEGHVSSLYALLRGKTGATVRLAYEAGMDPVRLKLQHCLSTPLREQAPFLLGSSAVRLLEVARLYSAIAAEGRLATASGLAVSLRSHEGAETALQNGKVVQAFTPEAAAWVRGVMVAALKQPALASVLKENGLGGAGLAGFGGTAYGFTDAWFAGSDQRVTCLVWMGYDESRGMGQGAWARDTVFPAWAEVMAAATAGSAKGWPVQDSTAICLHSGALAGRSCLQDSNHLLMPFPATLRNVAASHCLYHPVDGGKPGAPAGVAEVFNLTKVDQKRPGVPQVRSVKAAQPAVVGPDIYGAATRPAP